MRTLFVVNPAAGSGRCGRQIGRVIQRLKAEGLSCETTQTTGPGHATTLVREARAQGVHRFIIVGGDGTGFEVLNGLFDDTTAPTPTLGYLPLGTGNSFIRDLGITDEDTAVSALLRDTPQPVDVLRATTTDGAFFSINLISAGFTADAGELMNRRFKSLGTLGYVAGVVGRLATLSAPSLPIALDGGPVDTRPATLLSFCNSRCTGGTMQMAPDARLSDGQVDIIRVGKMSRTRLLTAFPRIFRGTHLAMPEVESATAKRVTIDIGHPVDWMVDGEILRRELTEIEVLPGHVQVLA
ncbi:MAG: diacylglycerol kinase (ATP) [Myxococcota bacterium]